ncbi:MAG TPA: hypothetical protein VG099_19610 [Gemmataceae bacterium]|jgi:hypothetical protein|nr:hypothetical protein [Gemmataceae bacterium]
MAKSSNHLHTLYCGTSERIAKLAPRTGLNPNNKPVYLTDVYPGVFAFYASTNDNDRFGVLEIDLSILDPTNFLPCEQYLEQASRQKAKNAKEQHKRLEAYRKTLERHKAKWKDSLQRIGVITYDGFVSKKAIRRITIYDPASNPTITGAIVNSHVSLSDYKKFANRNRAVTRWLAGETVTVEEWLGDDFLETPKEERELLAERLQNKLGLDIFYHEPPAKGS